MTEGKGGISPYKLMIYKRMNQKYRTKWKGGKPVYDLQAALKEDELVKKFYKDKPVELSDMLYKTNKAIEKRYILIVEPKDHPEGHIREKEIFGNIKGKRGFNNLYNEIENLFIKGEALEKHSTRLQWEYHQNEKIIRDLWEFISKNYEQMSQEEIKLLREFLKNQ